MRKKILSLALALALCLGLTIPAFAAKTWTETYEGITITAYPDGSTVYLSYTGAGKLTVYHLKMIYLVDTKGVSTIIISIGQGVTITDEFKEYWNEFVTEFREIGISLTYNDSTTPAQPQQPAGTAASPTNDKLEVNGNAADPTVYKINGSNYFKIRDVAALLNGTEKQFAVGYDGSKNAVTATTGQGYEKQPGDLAGAATGGDQSAAASNDAIYVNGEKITAEVYKINGSNYFKLRDLGRALDFYVGWSADRGVYIETGKPYSE